MSETIRDRIKRRVRWCAAIGLGGWLVIFWAMTKSRGGKPPSPFVALGFVLFLGAMLALQWAIRCPRCSQRFGQEIGMRIGLSVFKKPPNFCPYCGVSLDEPYSRVPDPGQSQNPIK